MDNETLKLIARLKVAAARAGQNIDVVRFAADRDYARTSMQQFANATDEQGALLVLHLMEKLHMTAAVPPPPAAVAPAAPAAKPAPVKEETDTRYIGRLR
jgi:hypothetical protein